MKQEIHFITGKGGVGKSAFAAAFVSNFAEAGKKTLLVELGDYSFYKDYLGLAQVQFEPTKWKENIDVCLWRGEDCLYEYARYLIKVESLVKLFFNNSVMKTFIQIAPALPELAIMGKITSHHRQHGPPLQYDVIVIDSYATGHFKALIKAAQAMFQSFQFGPMAQQSQGIDRVLKDTSICHYHIVTLPEELPIKEAKELSTDIENILNQKSNIYINKCLSKMLSDKLIKNLSNESLLKQNPFVEYLQEHKKNEEDAIHSCHQINQRTRELPLILSNEPHVVIQQLQRAMP